MRILYLLTQDLDSPLGVGRIWPLAKVMAAKGHRVRIAAPHSQWQTLRTRKFVQDGVLVEYVSPMHVIKGGNQKRYYSPIGLIWVSLRMTLGLLKSACSEKEDIIHIGKPHPMNSIAGWIASKLLKGKLCLDCDDYEAESNHFGQKWQKKVIEIFEKEMPRHCQLVTTNTHFMMSKLESWGCPGERIHYLSNGIDRERFTRPSRQVIQSLISQYRLEGKPVVLYAGSLSIINHPVDLLLKAFVIVQNQIPSSALVLVGGGEDYSMLVELAKTLGIEQNVRFTGRVDPQAVSNYYALANVSVDPIFDDAAARGRSPLKLFESWISSVPFVSAAVGERIYLLGQPPAGILVQPAGDAQALANGILEVFRSNSYAQSLAQIGLERAQNFDWARLADELEVKYRNLL